MLKDFSKISATVHIAVPVLEFLSTLISLPQVSSIRPPSLLFSFNPIIQVFGGFKETQFLMVFAITLPYTNPFKFNHYTVSLAHHVIIMWFLKCRLANRKDFVKFIIKGLNSNILQPFEEGNFRTREERNLASLNQDSSSRKRSSSLKEETPSRRVRHMTGVSSRPTLARPEPDERQVLLTFHQELTETCQDLMARYTFSNCGVQPRRGPVAEQLLSQGTSRSWLVGNTIVTITVSGCAQESGKTGLCDACQSSCQPTEQRRRHTSEQSSRVRRAGGSGGEPPQPLVAGGGEEKDRVLVCGCWCTGWCEVKVRRPSGVTSWVARVQNGVLSNQPQDEAEPSLKDLTELLMPSLPTLGPTPRVERANSNPELEVRSAFLELDLAHSSYCSPILEEDEGPRARAATFSTPADREPRVRSILVRVGSFSRLSKEEGGHSRSRLSSCSSSFSKGQLGR